MNYYKSNKYVLIWQLKNAENYKFTKDGKCFNTKTNNEIKKVLINRSIGYCINGKFYSLNTLRKNLEKIPVKIKLPF